jgi:hypothetical protein
MSRPSSVTHVLHFAVFVSIIAFLAGVIFLLISYQFREPSGPPTLLSEVLRDLGIVLCSIGLISSLYEFLIRRQLLDDYNTALQTILDPDTKKLGVRALFRDRDDKSNRGRSLDALLRATRHEMLCYGLGCYQFLPEKQNLLLAKIKDGCCFEFLIFNPESRHATALDESLGYGNGTLINFLHAQQRFFIEFMKTLDAEGLKGKFAVRVYDAVPTFGGLAVDRSMPTGSLIVELYGTHVEGSVCPGMELLPGNSDWYAFYDRQIVQLWETSPPLVVPGQKEGFDSETSKPQSTGNP